MGRVVLTALVLILALYLLPIVLKEKPQELSAAPEDASQASTLQPQYIAPDPTLTILNGDQVTEMALSDYLWGVVAAEMPAAFEPEALKAQAVAARTYALRKAEAGSANHPDADLCTDHTCCQAYITPEAAEKNWGENAAFYADKITQAVQETRNQVIRYDGELINAVFHSSSAGSTLDSVEVWGGNVSYLKGVDSPEGEEVPNYHSESTISLEEFKTTFLGAYPQADLSGAPESWFGAPDATASGAVRSITVGGVSVKGAELRTLFSLRSASFTVSANETGVTFRVTGYGHGVGMSQYGANAMAKEGKTWQDILAWYYTGVSIEPY